MGEDGATHHGAFDLSYLRHIPNIVVMAPKDEAELRDMIATATACPGPAAVRYPRGVGVGTSFSDQPQTLPIGKGELLHDGKDALIVALGSRVYPAVEAAEELKAEHGLHISVFNARFVKPLPEQQLLDLALRFKRIVIVEENALAGGFSSAVLEMLSDNNAMAGLHIRRVGLPDSFVEHGKQKQLREAVGTRQKTASNRQCWTSWNKLLAAPDFNVPLPEEPSRPQG